MSNKSTLARFGAVIAGGLMLCAASSASAGLIGVTDIRITSALPDWLQVTEVTAAKTAGGDAASILAGAFATSSGFGFGGTPDKAIDDLNAGGTHAGGEFHSDTPNFGEFLNIALSGPTELDSITIFGRSDCCSTRDHYNLQLLDIGGNVLFEAFDLGASGTSHQVSVNLPDTSTPPTTQVSEPGMLAIFGLGLAGLGFARRRKTA